MHDISLKTDIKHDLCDWGDLERKRSNLNEEERLFNSKF